MKTAVLFLMLVLFSACTTLDPGTSGSNDLRADVTRLLEEFDVELGGSTVSCKYADTTTFNFLYHPITEDYAYFITVAELDLRNYPPSMPVDDVMRYYRNVKNAALKDAVEQIAFLEK